MYSKKVIKELIEQEIITGKKISKSQYEQLKSKDETKNTVYNLITSNGTVYVEFQPEDLEDLNIQTLINLKILDNTFKMKLHLNFFYTLIIIILMIGLFILFNIF